LNTVVTAAAIPESEIQEIGLPIEESIDFTPYILWSLYGIISLLLMVRFGKNIWKLTTKSKSNPSVKYKNANLVLVPEKTLPHTFLNSIFINFEDYNNRNIEDELYTHELVHVTQKHTLDILFIEFLKVIFWFNPIFILYKKAIQLNHEFLADEEIVKTYNNVPFYQNLLLQKSSGNPTIYLASNLNYLVTKKRLIMMTKSTSQKIAVLKKIAIVPILAGLIYFFCVEVVAQEKVVGTKTEQKKEQKEPELTDKDKLRDAYYKGVYVKICDEKTKRKDVTLYENLSLEDKRKYLFYVPNKQITENKITENLFEKMKKGNMAVWIDNKVSNRIEINKYKHTDIVHFSSSFVFKNARSKRFPQEYQYSLYTKDYFDKNLKNSYLHFSGDTIRISNGSYKTDSKSNNKLNSQKSTFERSSKDEEGYKLYINEKKEKKVIVIDASHGGHDFGATIDGLKEKELIFAITEKIKAMYSDSEVEIHFTRTADEFVGLSERTDFVNSIHPDLVISLHITAINAIKNSDRNGFEIYVSDKNEFFEKSKIHAENLSLNLSKTQLENGGIKTAPFWILEKSNTPSMLVELGFITNEKDRKYVSSEKGQTEIAKNILKFISDMK
jgi:N-acetylmuramoyl-L-alanine amidase